jgi:alpha-beta hydrolase superfamily lysophospholipase
MRHTIDKRFTTDDGTTLFYRYWPASSAVTDRAIILVHYGHEDASRLQHIVATLGLSDYTVFAWYAGGTSDTRGDGPRFAASVKDLDRFIRLISSEYRIPVGNLAVIAQSVGAVLVSTWAHDYAPSVRCLVLAAPAFKAKLFTPCEAARRVIEDAQAIHVPVQVFASGSYWGVVQRTQRRFFERLGSSVKELYVLDGLYEGTLVKNDRRLILDQVRKFITRVFEQKQAVPLLLNADRRGFTKDEEARLSASLPALSANGLRFRTVKMAMNTLGRASDGVRLGLKTGFDSGSTLDYVYRNCPAGITFLGKLLDRNYLNSIGWKGIRVRKIHIEEAIIKAAGRLREVGRPVRITDIAAGHGRYVLEATERLPQQPESILLRDYSDINVRDGTALIEQKKLDPVARFVKADAFDEAGVASINPRPTIAIVSGLYELFPENPPVAASLRGLGRAVEKAGYLIYTGQPWHPQLELIARTLTSHRDKKAWVMRRRTQAELDQLVAGAGFRKIEQWIDEWGIFTVSLAVRA